MSAFCCLAVGEGGAARFREARQEWFRKHGDGTELQGTLSEQSTLFDRLRDKIFGHRRGRANPSGTTRQTRSSEPSS